MPPYVRKLSNGLTVLLVHLPRRLREEGFTVLLHAAVPPGDEGLSFGRACAGLLAGGGR